jgi:hypothetical protein
MRPASTRAFAPGIARARPMQGNYSNAAAADGAGYDGGGCIDGG